LIGALPTTTAAAVHRWGSTSRAAGVDPALERATHCAAASARTTGNGTGIMESRAMAATTACAADPRGARCQSAVRSELGISGYQFVADSRADLSATGIIAWDTGAVGRQSAQSSRRTPRRADLMATAADGANRLRQVHSGDRQPAVWLAAALALRSQHSGLSTQRSTIREIHSAGRAGWGRQSALWNRALHGRAWSVATENAYKDRASARHSGVCWGYRRQPAVWDGARLALEHARPVADRPADADSLQQAGSGICCGSCREDAVQSGLVLGGIESMAGYSAGDTGKKVIARHTGTISRFTATPLSGLALDVCFVPAFSTIRFSATPAFSGDSRPIGRSAAGAHRRYTLVERAALGGSQWRSYCRAHSTACGSRQPAVRDAPRLALGGSQSMATENPYADRAGPYRPRGAGDNYHHAWIQKDHYVARGPDRRDPRIERKEHLL